ncbi:MAG TPA: LacI family DNA-binding transcriptional regulator [Solirubrobacteraceae bacterium]|jgi:DNA-binding LacI/PurR family transcriptional regulator|nr:LacI family DNA-binding transcriptional regulator [Solirubrobacteraceae bacterium]
MTTERVKTIADVARIAGVSKATVSRALNDSTLVSAETRERVRAIAQQHGFEMNATARSLSRRETNVIALATYPYEPFGPTEAAPGFVPTDKLPDTFVLEVMSGLAAGLHARGYDLLVIQIDSKETGWISRYLDSGRVDGFVLMAASCTIKHLEALETRGAPFVVWGLDSTSHAYSTVSGDSYAGGRIATQHLLDTGRRRITFIGGPETEQEAQDRYRGYASALRGAHVGVDASLVTYGWYSSESATLRMRELLAAHGDIDAVFACSDVMAIAAIEELRAAGRRVPDDVAVVGYDDVALAAHANPPLTTVRQPGPLAGRLLADSLIQQLRTGAVGHVSIPAELVVRESA